MVATIDVEIATLSEMGSRSHNEDVVRYWQDSRYLLCMVSDGAGGHGGGDVAADIVGRSVIEGFANAPSSDPARLRALLENANRAIVEEQLSGGEQFQMRATVVVAVIDKQAGTMAWVHCGDSRAYLIRDGLPVVRTVDHSLVQQMISSGILREEEAKNHPKRNVLISALGSVDEPPEITVTESLAVSAGDIILLCSDGLWEPIGEERMLNLLQGCRTPRQWLLMLDRSICSLALPRQDNYSAISAWVIDANATRIIPVG